MNKIKGIGEIHEGILEKDPLDDGFQIRGLDADGRQEVIRLAEVFNDYVGQSVRFTIARTASLEAEARRIQAETGLQSVALDDLRKS